jgi:hypothetical protein
MEFLYALRLRLIKRAHKANATDLTNVVVVADILAKITTVGMLGTITISSVGYLIVASVLEEG